MSSHFKINYLWELIILHYASTIDFACNALCLYIFFCPKCNDAQSCVFEKTKCNALCEITEQDVNNNVSPCDHCLGDNDDFLFHSCITVGKKSKLSSVSLSKPCHVPMFINNDTTGICLFRNLYWLCIFWVCFMFFQIFPDDTCVDILLDKLKASRYSAFVTFSFTKLAWYSSK